jgi:outer membrane lipoprotein-sorting protein
MITVNEMIMRTVIYGLLASLFLSSYCFSPVFGQSFDKLTTDLIYALKNKYAVDGSLSAEFEMQVQYPDQDLTRYPGQYYSKGSKYRVDMNGQSIISNGEKQWVWDKQNQYVEIYSAEDQTGFSPDGILKLLHSDEYSYAIVFEGMLGGDLVKQIEFKPNDDFSDLTKARLTILADSHVISGMKVFYRDASTMDIQLKNLRQDAILKSSLFEFDSKKHPEVTIEDLRLD